MVLSAFGFLGARRRPLFAAPHPGRFADKPEPTGGAALRDRVMGFNPAACCVSALSLVSGTAKEPKANSADGVRYIGMVIAFLHCFLQVAVLLVTADQYAGMAEERDHMLA